MIRRVRLGLRSLTAFMGMIPKLFLAYRFWVWMDFFVRILSLSIIYYFWGAIYTGRETLNGLARQEALNYVLLAHIFTPIVMGQLPLVFGRLIREGSIGIELLRPVDFQSRWYAESLAVTAMMLVVQLPLAAVACIFFDLKLPSDPQIWAVFAVSLVLGQAIIFLFDWMFSCLAFYTTEVWGLWVLREGIAAFFSGALLPLPLMPGWLEQAVRSLPFAQALYVPVSILSGVAQAADAPRLWLTQVVWLAGLLILSRLVFRMAVRKITVQGG